MTDVTIAEKRGPGRPPTANREPVHTARTRRRRFNNTDDRFALPMDEIPEGSTYEWKRFSVHGQEDPFYIAHQRQQGWEPVDPKRHPNWLPEGYQGNTIIKDGLLLMERPIELTMEARDETRKASRRQIDDQKAQLGMTPNGQLPRDADARTRPQVKSEMMRQVVED